MAKVTSKLQVTVPKALAERYGIRPGDDIRLEEAGESLRVVPAKANVPAEGLDIEARLRLFDAATTRQRERQTGRPICCPSTRGWSREQRYERGRSDTDR